MIPTQLTIAIPNTEPETPNTVPYDPVLSATAIRSLLDQWTGEYLLLRLPGGKIDLSDRSVQRYLQVAADTGAGWLYSDFREQHGTEISDHPLIDYQPGSIRDNFDFGSIVVLSRRAVDRALRTYGGIPNDVEWGGLYDLRLKLSIDSELFRIPEPLYTRSTFDVRTSGEKIFDYVDPRKRDYQIEMERIATAHLKRIGAYLEPRFRALPATSPSIAIGAIAIGVFPVRASVIIPVRNRVKTITDAVKSALSQKTDFDFNVIVVDNHSTDGTTAMLTELTAENDRMVHLIPARTDLGIGGCWNEAVFSDDCGRYAVQLDSDDIYSGERTLSRIVAEFEKAESGNRNYAMVIGSYTIVDFDLNELPPGLIDHREWTSDNGRNNALRINGLGAPRAFDTAVLRHLGLPNTSYGEDYAVALRLSREYEIGRIYDSLYFARRWAGNSDSALSVVRMNGYDAYKDRLRTIEIRARQRMNEREQNR